MKQLRVRFGQPKTHLATGADGITVDLRMPHLAGPADEVILRAPGTVESPFPGSALLAGEGWLAGAFVRPWHGPLDEVALALYRELLLEARGWSIGRIWNYVPDINSETTGLENYRRFNLGRWQAYHDAFGEALASHLPAASAVGLHDDKLVAIFIATREPVRRVENPQQVPAWRYPQLYGPKSPSFVRGAAAGANGSRHAWVSGTASIRGHESLALNDVLGQLAVTVENLDVVLGALSLAPLAAAPEGHRRFTKVYLRRAADLEAVRAAFEQSAPPAAGDVMYVQADVCRAELDLEIEVTETPSA